MSPVKKFWSGQRLLERWGIPPTELASFIYQGLPAYKIKMDKGEIVKMEPAEIHGFDYNHMTDLLFMPTEIEEFEKVNDLPIKYEPEANNIEMMAKENRELGQLRREKNKWDNSIAAAVQVGVYCANLGRALMRREVVDFVNNIDNAIPLSAIEQMWKALPIKYRKGSGRPREEESH
jgi:hypothetical protein